MRRRLFLVVLALLLLPLAGCGGGGSDDPEKVVRDFAKAVSDSDADKLCNDLLTDEARQQVSGATGDDAGEQCEKELGKVQGREIEIRRVVSEKVKDDDATVIAEVRQGQASGRQVFKLKKEDGDFRVASLGQ